MSVLNSRSYFLLRIVLFAFVLAVTCYGQNDLDLKEFEYRLCYPYVIGCQSCAKCMNLRTKELCSCLVYSDKKKTDVRRTVCDELCLNRTEREYLMFTDWSTSGQGLTGACAVIILGFIMATLYVWPRNEDEQEMQKPANYKTGPAPALA